MSNGRGMYAITVPELGLGPCPITVSLWLVPHGARVRRGDRVVELLAGDATVDLSAPATGVLIRRDAREEDEVAPRQVIAWIRAAGSAGCVDGAERPC